ncbi:exonuclease domain-containing protein [Nocardia gamkensis]|uniref:exonuclease domain-containing protein n=1 Tax=Nocardia gamkensis TaxID=352869 RepID=UPI0037C5FBE2
MTAVTHGLSFAAIDVETANSTRGSICAIGLAIVRDGIRETTHSWLCRPPGPVDYFAPFNITLHKITPEKVASQPSFGELWSEVAQLIGELPIVAHNAAFDVGAIREACSYSGVPWPTFDYGCTLVWSRRLLDLISYRLPLVAVELGIALPQHHDARHDVTAAADIAIALAARAKSNTVHQLAQATKTRLGRLTTAGWNGCHGFGGANLTPPEATGTDTEHPLYGQTIVFTGGLASMTRQEAWQAVAACGATPDKAVTKRTTRLVIGDGFTGSTPDDFTTQKAHKAVGLRAKGQRIEILTEVELLEYLGQGASAGRNEPNISSSRSKRASLVKFTAPAAQSWIEPGPGRASEPYWRWVEASLAGPDRAQGGEPCRICSEPIAANAAWKHRDRHVCGSTCNDSLKRRWKKALDNGTLPAYEPPLPRADIAEIARLPAVFGENPSAQFPLQHGRWPKIGDVVIRDGLTTRYLPMPARDTVQWPAWLHQVIDQAGGWTRTVLVACDEINAWSLAFVDDQGRPTSTALGRFYLDGTEQLMNRTIATAAGDVCFSRELISDVDDDGNEFRWEAHIFARSPARSHWTPARDELSRKRKRASTAAAESRKSRPYVTDPSTYRHG